MDAYGQKVPKLNIRPVYCSRLYGSYFPDPIAGCRVVTIALSFWSVELCTRRHEASYEAPTDQKDRAYE